MLVGYIRVSTEDQNLDRQEKIMEQMGVDKVYAEKISGKNTERPQLKAMLGFVREGDVIFVESISRLARSTRDLLNLLSDLTARKVEFISDKEKIDTTTPQGRFVLTIFSALAELERETLLQRQKEGICVAQTKGIRFGRPQLELPENWVEVLALWSSGKLRTVDAVKRTGLARSSFYKQANLSLRG